MLAFMQACIFQDGQVPRCKTWANQRISPQIAVESAVVWRSDKRVRIEPLIRISEHDRACECRITERADRIARVAVIRRIVAKLWSEWKTGLCGHNAVDCPSAHHAADHSTAAAQKTPALSEGQFIRCSDDANTPDVVRCQPPIRASAPHTAVFGKVAGHGDAGQITGIGALASTPTNW